MTTALPQIANPRPELIVRFAKDRLFDEPIVAFDADGSPLVVPVGSRRMLTAAEHARDLETPDWEIVHSLIHSPIVGVAHAEGWCVRFINVRTERTEFTQPVRLWGMRASGLVDAFIQYDGGLYGSWLAAEDQGYRTELIEPGSVDDDDLAADGRPVEFDLSVPVPMDKIRPMRTQDRR